MESRLPCALLTCIYVRAGCLAAFIEHHPIWPQSLGDAPTETPKLCAAAFIAAERVLIISELGEWDDMDRPCTGKLALALAHPFQLLVLI